MVLKQFGDYCFGAMNIWSFFKEVIILLAAVHYVATLADGTKFESTRDRDEPVTIKLGKGELLMGMICLVFLKFNYW